MLQLQLQSFYFVAVKKLSCLHEKSKPTFAPLHFYYWQAITLPEKVDKKIVTLALTSSICNAVEANDSCSLQISEFTCSPGRDFIPLLDTVLSA
jgi:hypothetical protein